MTAATTTNATTCSVTRDARWDLNSEQHSDLMKNSKRFEWNANYLISQILRKREQLENGKWKSRRRKKMESQFN